MGNEQQSDHDRITVMETKLNSVLGFGKVVVTVCVTATLSLAGMLWNLGAWLYDNSDKLKAAIKAWYGVRTGGQ